MHPGLPTHAGSASSVAPVQRPEKSGFPPTLGAGAFALTLPFASRGTPGVGCLMNCAADGAAIAAANRMTTRARIVPNGTTAGSPGRERPTFRSAFQVPADGRGRPSGRPFSTLEFADPQPA